MNLPRAIWIRFHKISALPDSFLMSRRSQRNEGRTKVGLTIFPDARPIRTDRPPTGGVVSILATSSKDSHRGPVSLAQGEAGQPEGDSPDLGARRSGPEILAVAAEGNWPGASSGAAKPFRLVLVGNSNFATNAYLSFAANGDLAVGMVRWLAGDEATPATKT